MKLFLGALFVIVVIIAGWFIFSGLHSSSNPQSDQNLSVTTSSTQTTTSTQSIQPTSTVQQESPIVSSSTAQVGKFTVVADCDASENVFKIEIFKNGVRTQVIEPYTQLASGGGSCPIPEVKDINSDGYPDFAVAYNYGNKYVDSSYWLYNSSTDQFSCPNATSSGKKICELAEPY